MRPQFFRALVVLISLAAVSCGGGATISPGPGPSPDFSIQVTPAATGVTQGGAGSTVNVTISPLHGFNSNVIVTLLTLPAGVTTNPVSPFPVAAGATLAVTFTASAAAATGSLPVTFHGSSGTRLHSAGLSLSVNAPPPANAVRMTLDPARQFQTWTAWRASAGGPQFILNNGATQVVPPVVMSAVLDDAVFDLGITGLRLNLHANWMIESTNDNNDPNVINWAAFDFTRPFLVEGGQVDPVLRYQQMVMPFKQRVESRGEPFHSYVSPIYTRAAWPAHWQQNPEEYAEVAEAFVTWLRTPARNAIGVNLTPDYWVVVNEPDLHNFPDAEIAADVIAVGTRFQARGIPTRVATIESAGPDLTMLNSVLSVPGVRNHVSMLTFHGYDYFTPTPAEFARRNGFRSAAQSFGAQTGMSEICCKAGWDRGGYDHGLGYARDIYWNMTEADVSVWEPLALMNPCNALGCPTGGGPPLVLDADLSRHFKFAHYYALRQYSRYIRPGARRLALSCDNCANDATLGLNVKGVAFRSPAGKTLAVVLNDQLVAQSVALNGFPAGAYDITGVDPLNATSPVNYPGVAIGAGQPLTVNLPAQAILTIVQQ